MADADPLRLELPAEARSVRVARHAVSDAAARAGAPVAHVAVCVSEAVTNAVLHAYRDREDGSGTIYVSAEMTDSLFQVTVEDDGLGMVPRADSPGLGLGLPTMSELAVDVEITARTPGLTVSMQFQASRLNCA
jgi:serine/threonine-protein kinase RsbW/stage II sporulation protein AB (anti-sigma F factor)